MASKEKPSATPDLSQLTMLANALPPDFRESVLKLGKAVLEIRKAVRSENLSDVDSARLALEAAKRLADELDKVLPDKAVKAFSKSKTKSKTAQPASS